MNLLVSMRLSIIIIYEQSLKINRYADVNIKDTMRSRVWYIDNRARNQAWLARSIAVWILTARSGRRSCAQSIGETLAYYPSLPRSKRRVSLLSTFALAFSIAAHLDVACICSFSRHSFAKFGTRFWDRIEIRRFNLENSTLYRFNTFFPFFSFNLILQIPFKYMYRLSEDNTF